MTTDHTHHESKKKKKFVRHYLIASRAHTPSRLRRWTCHHASTLPKPRRLGGHAMQLLSLSQPLRTNLYIHEGFLYIAFVSTGLLKAM